MGGLLSLFCSAQEWAYVCVWVLTAYTIRKYVVNTNCDMQKYCISIYKFKTIIGI